MNVLGREEKGARVELGTLRDPGVWDPTLASLRPRSPGLLLPASRGPWNLGFPCLSQTRSKRPQPSPSSDPGVRAPRPPVPSSWLTSGGFLCPQPGVSAPFHTMFPLPWGAWAGGNFPRRQSRGSQPGRVAGPGGGAKPPTPCPAHTSGMAACLLIATAVGLQGWLGLRQEFGERQAVREPVSEGVFTG